MLRRSTKIGLLLCLALGLASAVFSQVQTGSITGQIKDNENNPLPGVTLTISSPNMMGTRTFVSTEGGTFRFPALPPGSYTLKGELQGFKTVEKNDIVIRVGMVITLDISMELATLEHEVSVTGVAPVVDVQQSKIAISVDNQMLRNLPVARDMLDVINSAPGANWSEGGGWGGADRMTSVHGSSVRDNTYAFDGVNMNDPVNMNPVTNLNFDVIEEVEMILGGQSAEVGFTSGAYVNIVTRSGGNKFSGGVTFYNINENYFQQLWTKEQFQAMGVSKPSVDKNFNDLSLSLGGPILRDKLWFFGNGRYLKNVKRTTFLPWDLAYAIPGGYEHNPWPEWYHRETMGFLKLTTQLSSKLRVMGMFNYTATYRPIDSSPGSRTFFDATRKWDENVQASTLTMTYILNQNTYVDVKGSYVHRYFKQPFQDSTYTGHNVAIWNYGTNFSTGAQAYEESWKKNRYQITADITRFQENWLGGNHELKLGLEFTSDKNDWNWWRKDPLYWQWYRGSPYYNGLTVASDVKTYGLPPGSVGIGYSLIGAYIVGPNEGDNPVADLGTHISSYLQDSMTIARRLTINAGLRYDYAKLDKPGMKMGTAGNPFVVWLGDNVVSPYAKATYPSIFPNGINPWQAASAGDWKGVMSWSNLSPRLGLTFDLFGNGKTALKAFAGRYVDYLSLRFALAVSPFDPGWSWRIYWFDLNKNGSLDQSGDYYWFPGYLYDLRKQDLNYAHNMIDPNIKAPYTEEFTTGISHELTRNVFIGVNYHYKHKKNIWQRTYYNVDTKEYWYHWDQAAAKKFYTEFTCIVPGTGNYADQQVTIYLQKQGGPAGFYRGTNIPELVSKYQAVEFILNKRMSDGWQFSGSMVIGKAYGNLSSDYSSTAGWTGSGITPTWYVNRDGRQATDRPLAIKLMGSVDLSHGVLFSAYFRYFGGQPWGRSATIRPPAAWCAANGAVQQDTTVYIEPIDTRRYPATNQLDLRLEKSFDIRRVGRIGAFVDVLNVLGYTYVNVGQNDIARYSPSNFGVREPQNVLTNSSYKLISSVSGLRSLRLCLRYSF